MSGELNSCFSTPRKKLCRSHSQVLAGRDLAVGLDFLIVPPAPQTREIEPKNLRR